MKIKYIRAVLIVLAVVFIGLGLNEGGYVDTFNKGVHICLECIGIG